MKFATLALSVCICATPLLAQDSSPPTDLNVNSSLQDARWFDAETGQIQPIDIVPRVDDSIHRDSRWLPKPKRVKKPPTTTTPGAGGTGAGATGTGLFGSNVTLGNVFAWMLLFATLIAIVGFITYMLSRAELNLGDSDASTDKGKQKGLPDKAMLERIKHLPPELRRTDVNLRTECERLMNDGRYDQAIILLLGHQLLLLDQGGLLRLSRGKTNGRYVRETRSRDANCSLWLRETADAFEQSYFGRHTIPRDVFAQLWDQNQQLEERIRELEAAE